MIVCEPGKHTDGISNASLACSPSCNRYSPYRQKYTAMLEQVFDPDSCYTKKKS